jgi:hypothetical protein
LRLLLAAYSDFHSKAVHSGDMLLHASLEYSEPSSQTLHSMYPFLTPLPPRSPIVGTALSQASCSAARTAPCLWGSQLFTCHRHCYCYCCYCYCCYCCCC